MTQIVESNIYSFFYLFITESLVKWVHGTLKGCVLWTNSQACESFLSVLKAFILEVSHSKFILPNPQICS